MNCKDLQELLSAYADGELAGTQRDFIEEHLNGCADCRAALVEYKKLSEQFLSLWQTPAMPDIIEATMTKIKLMETHLKLRRWLRPALVVAPVIIILAVVLPLQLSGSPLSPSGVIARAYAATEKLESYRIISDSYRYIYDELGHSYHSEFEVGGHDRYYSKGGYTEKYSKYMSTPFIVTETIVISNQIYSLKPDYYPIANVDRYDENTPTREKTLQALELLIEIETLPDEEIDGTDCYHYRGTVDTEKWLEWYRPYMEENCKRMIKNTPWLKLDYEKLVKDAEDMWRKKEMINEFWIGKDDYLIRQQNSIIRTFRDDPLSEATPDRNMSLSITKYYDFNEPIVIKPPLDESGELLEGWEVISMEELTDASAD